MNSWTHKRLDPLMNDAYDWLKQWYESGFLWHEDSHNGVWSLSMSNAKRFYEQDGFRDQVKYLLEAAERGFLSSARDLSVELSVELSIFCETCNQNLDHLIEVDEYTQEKKDFTSHHRCPPGTPPRLRTSRAPGRRKMEGGNS